MKKETRDRAKRFLTSESGRVGIRTPLTLGVASGVLLLSQMMFAPPAEASCYSDNDCGTNGWCHTECKVYENGTCDEWKSECVYDS